MMARNCCLTTWIFLRLTSWRFGRALIFHRKYVPCPSLRSEGVLCLRNQPRIAESRNEFAWLREIYEVVPANNTAANFRQLAARAGTWDQYFPGCLSTSTCSLDFSSVMDLVLDNGVHGQWLQVCQGFCWRYPQLRRGRGSSPALP